MVDRKQFDQAHRCDGSLRNYLSIRGGKAGWALVENAYDFDYMVHYQHQIALIRYCPFCGEKLPDLSDGE